MSGERGTETEITEIEDLQAEIHELESNLEACQDDLADMTQRRKNLASELAKAIEALVDISNIASQSDNFFKTYTKNS